VVDVAEGLSDEARQRALRTRNMIGLDPRERTDANVRRLQHRRDAWTIAAENRARLLKLRSPEFMASLVDLARSRGYWSVWMTVFADDPEMRRRLIAGFKGTCAACFDANGDAVARAGGIL
jgi:hypothetical protein